MSDAQLIASLRAHAYDDCRGMDPATHICSVAADRIEALTAARDAAIEEAADALVSYVRAAKKSRFSEPDFLDAYRAIRALADKERRDA